MELMRELNNLLQEMVNQQARPKNHKTIDRLFDLLTY